MLGTPCYTNDIINLDGSAVTCQGFMEPAVITTRRGKFCSLKCSNCHDQSMVNGEATFPLFTAIVEGKSAVGYVCGVCYESITKNDLILHGAPKSPNQYVYAHHDCATSNGFPVIKKLIYIIYFR